VSNPVVILGATGQVGTSLARLLPGAGLLGRADLDLAHPADVGQVLDRLRPSTIFNCAGYTAVDAAEDDEELATVVNGAAVGAMAAWCARNKARLVTFSTDYVFDGDAADPYLESSPVNPINAYGRSKLVGEQLALESGAAVLLIRTSWVFSEVPPNFVATILARAARGNLEVVDDQWGRPTIASDLAAAVLEAEAAGATGILHLAGEGVTTWYELARTALEIAGINDQVRPCGTGDHPTRARRPRYSVLGSERASLLGLAPMPHWRTGLPAVVDALLAKA
jgi:dTDP-4-dehydrorhamnose reductase